MTDVQMKKDSFVRWELLALLQKIDRDILSIEYQIIGSEEFVQISWLNHSTGEKYHKRICVTGDSLKALTTDVLCHI